MPRRPEEIVSRPLDDRTDAQFLARAMASRFEPGDEVVRHRLRPRIEYRPLAARWRSAASCSRPGPSIARPGDRPRRTRTADDAERRSSSAVTHASNILGPINADPRDRPASFMRRGAQISSTASPMRRTGPIDVAALGVDYYVFSFYKTYGPHFAMHVRRATTICSSSTASIIISTAATACR